MIAAGAAGAGTATAAASGAAPSLHCRLEVPAGLRAGQPVPLRMVLRNTGPLPLDVLIWGTPFEGVWFAPYVGVLRGAVALRYGGASVKRGDPAAMDYLRIEPTQSHEAGAELSAVFSLATPGRYTLQPRITLHDVVVSGPPGTPRPRALHRPVVPDCDAVEFDIAP